MIRNNDDILLFNAQKRKSRELKVAAKKKKKRRQQHEYNRKIKLEFGEVPSYVAAFKNWIPENLQYVFNNENLDINFDNINPQINGIKGVFKVPRYFSLIEKPEESYSFIYRFLSSLLAQEYTHYQIDYSGVKKIDLGAQIYFDALMLDLIKFLKRCSKHPKTNSRVEEIEGVNINNEDVRKILFSVGSPTILDNKTIHFKDIIRYPLCVRRVKANSDKVKAAEKKDIDTSRLAEYVIECLGRMNKTLNEDRIDDLCKVIGEVLINAEEHSTTNCRYSVGYFKEVNHNDDEYGVFHLVILNFGMSIYEKFKDPYCENKEVVEKMISLSKKYTTKKWFEFGQFEEETLWTLYALQEGVTSVSPEEYASRGNGSIQFIESFFNIKGDLDVDDKSRLNIISGNTQIHFDGQYGIREITKNKENFKVMTFNKSGNIEEPPDRKYVKRRSTYFPGTIIEAKILINKDDIEYETE